ncbi:MAG: ArsR family transcriptional regulator [Desulfurococcales archaeon]|nr:ArsR family transcriptional regulator [Desulfurococcales archaeon]
MDGQGEEQHVDPLVKLAGTGMRVYMYMLARNRPVGVREVQRALGFKSPSTARHHLERLVELGLAEKTSDGYRAVKPQGLLGEYVNVRGRIIPRSALILGFTLGATTAYILSGEPDVTAIVILLVVLGLQAWVTLSTLRALRGLSQ